ncbi:MAG: hypothetical protein SPD90_09555 [Intestinibacter sp.]|uniref:hypothetical protein n=1 Tax=Intestinibacter sp. TaxID=1965304 RepID=UPI002A82CA4E|nr:hypothetical protein [Intestinibacter sp.]MDY4575290.1 hypothetical protein [Intestinibacter sp.]
MINVLLCYNSYEVETSVSIDGKELGEDSYFSKYKNEKIENWVQNLIPKIINQINESEFKLTFAGTKEDYESILHYCNYYNSKGYDGEKVNVLTEHIYVDQYDKKIKQLKIRKIINEIVKCLGFRSKVIQNIESKLDLISSSKEELKIIDYLTGIVKENQKLIKDDISIKKESVKSIKKRIDDINNYIKSIMELKKDIDTLFANFTELNIEIKIMQKTEIVENTYRELKDNLTDMEFKYKDKYELINYLYEYLGDIQKYIKEDLEEMYKKFKKMSVHCIKEYINLVELSMDIDKDFKVKDVKYIIYYGGIVSTDSKDIENTEEFLCKYIENIKIYLKEFQKNFVTEMSEVNYFLLKNNNYINNFIEGKEEDRKDLEKQYDCICKLIENKNEKKQEIANIIIQLESIL